MSHFTSGYRPRSLAALLSGLIAFAFMVLPATVSHAGQTIELACSAQVYEGFKNGALDQFTKKTGIKLKTTVTSSVVAIKRLENGAAQMAAIAEDLDYKHKLEGLHSYPFAKDALVIITHIQTKVNNLTLAQVKSIFTGEITNWKEVGGKDEEIRVIIPAKDTAAFNLFSHMVLSDARDLPYFLMARRSTDSASATHRYKGAISFVNQAATHGRPNATRIVKIDGLGPQDKGYPYYSIFSLVTKGTPTGALAKFIEYTFSKQGAETVKARGMEPIGY